MVEKPLKPAPRAVDEFGIATSRSDITHLYNRAGFGIHPNDVGPLTSLSWPALVDRILDTSSAPPASAGVPAIDRNADPRSGGWERYVAITQFWMERCRTAPAPIVEKMVLFWHGHLCTGVSKVFHHYDLLQQNQLFRTQGLGSFEVLVQKTSVQAAMLRYLDNDRNVAGRPNENFARELMELFTLGVGNYSEADVIAAAKAWTGHGLNKSRRYEFDSAAHDWSQKTFFGSTRNWDGPQIIDHIINGPKKAVVARFIATKLWTFFAYPNPESSVIDSIATAFVNGGMMMRPVLRAIFLHPQFRSAKAKSGLVRSPIEWAVAAMRMSGVDSATAHPEWQLGDMGQAPFNPPNVAGWKSNDYWLTSSAVWAKGRFASTIRWEMFHRGDLENIRNQAPAQAARTALAHFGIENPTTNTVNTLTRYVESERRSNNWADRAGLLWLPMLTPEFQLA